MLNDPINYEKWAVDLCSLLDAIEIALDEDDFDRASTLIAGRFDIAENYGIQTVITGVAYSSFQWRNHVK